MSSSCHRAALSAASIVSLFAIASPAFAGENGVRFLSRFRAQPVGNSAPIADSAGNLFGTSSTGGKYGAGFVYELTPPTGGGHKWALHRLHEFDGVHVQYPFGRLAQDSAGNLYGVSFYGGAGGGRGTLYELTNPGAGVRHWRLKVLHSFGVRAKDGVFPYAGVTIGPDGTIYGTTFAGGVVGVGTAYALSPPDGSGHRSYRILHQFHGETGVTDGDHPEGSILIDASGNLISTTSDAELLNANGSVFELSPKGDGPGGWRFKTLYTFKGGSDGSLPQGTLTPDGAGHIFGTTFHGGSRNAGTVYELTPPSGKARNWTEQVIAELGAKTVYTPQDGVSLDGQGRLFGTGDGGGGADVPYCFGGVFRLTPPGQGGGTWTEDVLALLGSANTARFGCLPAGSLTPLVGGVFYGWNGVNSPPGILYSVTP